MEKGKLIFVTGGVRSGKSSFAEETAGALSEQTGLNLHYVACGIPSDGEMRERISHHQDDRLAASVHWQTWECPYQLQRISSHLSKKDIIVLDCVTTLLNNYLFDRNRHQTNKVIDHILTDIFSLQKVCAHLIVVSNEVFQGKSHQESLTRNYQHMLGTIHQKVVSQADQAYLLENNIPIRKKGATR